MSLIKLTIKGISYSQTQSGAYALVLSEMEGTRTLPIIIGAFEAQSDLLLTIYLKHLLIGFTLPLSKLLSINWLMVYFFLVLSVKTMVWKK